MVEKELKIRIYGMTCDDCVAHVKNGLMKDPGVLNVDISLQKGTGEVKIDDSKTDPSRIISNNVFGKGSKYKASIIH
jgi:copper chaperone